MKPKSKFDWNDTGELKIRYDSETSASLRFFPADKVISKTTAKLLKTPCIETKHKININSPAVKNKPDTGKNKEKNEIKEKQMRRNNHTEYRKLSDLANTAIKRNDFVQFSQSHKALANILHEEGNYQDEIKSRILAFYFDVSGISQAPYIDSINSDAIALAAGNEGIGIDDICNIFFSTIKSDTAPNHSMTLMGSYKLLTLCLKRQWNKVNIIVNNLK